MPSNDAETQMKQR